MAEPMTLRDEDVGRIGEYVKPWLRELVEEMVPHVELGGVGVQLLERMVRVEEELRAQRTLMDERFNFMAQRFEAVDKRFEESIAHNDQRFEESKGHNDQRFDAVDQRFEESKAHSDKRFDDLNARFTALTWMIGVGFVVITSLTTVFALLA